MPVVLPDACAALPAPLRALLEPLLEEICRAYGTALISAAVFGSRARGVAGPESDIDLLLVAEELPQGRIPRVRQFFPVEEALAVRSPAFRTLLLSPIFKTPTEVRRGSPLFWDMTEDVILLYDREDFLQEQLAGVKRRLEALKARRVFRDNAWYWILKGDYRPGEVFEL